MATSESDDFESADEELDVREAPNKRIVPPRILTVVDSESDDDTECTSMHVLPPVRHSRAPRVLATRVMSLPKAGGVTKAVTAESAPASNALGARLACEQENAVPEKGDEKDELGNPRNRCSEGNVDAKVAKAGSGKSVTEVDGASIAVASRDQSTRMLHEENVTSQKPSELTEENVDGIVKVVESDSDKTETSLGIGLEPNAANRTLESSRSSIVSEDLGWSNSNEESIGTILKESSRDVGIDKSNLESSSSRRERAHLQRKPREPRQLGVKKLGAKIISEPIVGSPSIDAKASKEIEERALADGDRSSGSEQSKLPNWDSSWDNPVKPANVEECFEDIKNADSIEIPEELKSNKRFKEIFKPEGWEGMEDDIEIFEELTEEKIQPVLDKLSLASQHQENTSSWGSWGSWGVNSLLNTASAGVSTLTSHVTHGLTMLEETIGAPDPKELVATEQQKTPRESNDANIEDARDSQPQSSFGFGQFMSGVSSITKLVESTGTKVISGGLGTLETIGKKTMEVLQEGDPGLKKKRAFFLNESDKPILSKMLREAKEKAEVEEKTLEERQLARKVHFESLFDDYQGLVHLEALEMLSKQCNIKIQQLLISLDGDELNSLQETLEEIKELCDLGDEEEEEEEESNIDLKDRLKEVCKDLGIDITYDKLLDIWQKTKSYVSSSSSIEISSSDREIFQHAISSLAQVTAFSVERFHKTAELLLIKERRSTVNEADALVQLTRILSGQIAIVANSFSDRLNELAKTSQKPEIVNANITTIFLEAANASSYVQDAFKLLIPILQVGAT